MINIWKLTDEIRNKYTPIIKSYLNELDEIDIEYDELPTLDLTNTELNPSRLVKLLEEMGYKQGEMDTNGWQWDFWQPMNKSGDMMSDDLRISGCGMTFELILSTSEY